MASTTVVPNAIIPEFLNHTNYKHWSLRVKTYLLSKDLWDVVEPTAEIPKLQENDGEQDDDGEKKKVWTRKNAKALHIIQNSCGSDMFSLISEISNAQSAWEALEKGCNEKQKAENDAKEFERYIPFSNFVINGDWENAKECLTELPDAITARNKFGDIALHIAARKGHLHIVKELVLLMGQDDLKSKSADGLTALHLAFRNGRFDTVKELLPVMGGVKDCYGNTVLHMALLMQQPRTVKWMVKLMKREDLELKNSDGYTALKLAVKKGNVSTIKELLPYDDDFDRYIPFTNAVIEGDWNNAKYCLRDLDPYRAVRARDPRDGHENTALHSAIKHGHVDIVKELVSLMTQEDLEVKNADAFTGKLNADLSERAVVEMAKYMVEQNEILLARVLELENAFGDTPLHEAVSKGDMSIVEELVPSMRQEGFEIKNSNGFTALHKAVMNENVDIVKIIVRRMRREGLEVKGALGYTALHQAVKMGNMGIVKELVLLMRQEGLVVKNDEGSNALHLAVMNGNVDIVKMLVSLMRREDLEIKGALGYTALHQAVNMGKTGIVKELVLVMRQEGLEVKNDKGSNALHLAVMEKKNMDIVRELMSLMRPQAMEIRNGEGFTVLGCAMKVGHNDGDIWEMAKYMAEKNKKVFGTRSGIDIPVVWAAGWGKWKLTHYLYSVTPCEALNGLDGAKFISIAIERLEALDLAWDLLQLSPRLAIYPSNSPFYALASAHYAFFSGVRLTFWQSWIYNSLRIQPPSDLNIHETSADFPNFEDDQDMSWLRGPRTVLSKLLGINDMYKMKSVHQKISKILRLMCEVTRDVNLTDREFRMVGTSIFRAVEVGNVEFVSHICAANPKLLDYRMVRERYRTIFQCAANCRQEKIYSSLKKEKRERFLRVSAGKTNGTMLHSVANLSPLSQLTNIQGASLQMQRELQWFKEVESIVPPDLHNIRENVENLTARQLFTKSHEKIMEEAEKSVKQTASSCTVVGSLIATMIFAAAFTVPGGNDDNTGIPMFIQEKLFLTFIVSDTLSLVSSTTSVIIFLGLLTSRYAEDDFLKSLPKKLMTGLLTLFISIATMMIAFSSALVIMLHGRYSWIVAPSIFLASVPIASFVWVQFPLLLRTFISTYGPGIFDKKTKPWY
ncbi:uncharacterized protein LOC121050805 isoform X2 [Rosa chinensis]|uniref:uncharacterized protein LOC121050805 isoform X2 n=1 Tax=Rosa chinensis TaxID=74649 RepID=UPI001AD8DC44|nr:uncharacterized protein LOC121050805 isoform X2 [Rosa chinensis]